MNYCFLLENSKSFFTILPEWLKLMNFGYTRVKNIQYVSSDNYIITSSHGIERLENDLIFQTINEIKDTDKKIDKLIIIADAENKECEDRKQRILDNINREYHSYKIPYEIKVFICNRCIETWLLGCVGIYPSDKSMVSKYFMPFYEFYNIAENDPEKMNKPSTYDKSISSYHFQYIHALTQDISKRTHNRNLTYRKNKTECVTKKNI